MMLEIKKGYKCYYKQNILNNVNLRFEPQNIYGLKGDNGSGKTVLLKLLAGTIRLDRGDVFQNGISYGKNLRYIQNAGIVIEKVEFLSYLTLKENLELLKFLSPNITNDDIDYWIDYYNLYDFENIKYNHLSLGTQQKMGLIQAFIHKPDVLLLDEPMNALDEKSVLLTKKVILSYRDKKNGLVILTSHISENITDLCNEIFLLEEGEVKVVKE
ncbi:ATP-binding cassette domain-containing protein [Streptococcus hillyeri]|uniref:ABC transporter ATP-binding protein n=1 Tax=Streptococcus hillyeri TaxID=2282420 RepID=A0A3L9DT23_9STRE|nr:ABC transporter ATP-binding protein [Streptococcus hillyeri]RLY04135.1 ABC transporter ATP-binding protein [Streptococcus hillyeri]